MELTRSKLTYFILMIVVLQLVLIDYKPVESKLSIKKKIMLKKFKKVLPLFALFKPKKKFLILPIPMPYKAGTFGFPKHQQHHVVPGQQRPMMSYAMMDGSNQQATVDAYQPIPMVVTSTNNMEPAYSMMNMMSLAPTSGINSVPDYRVPPANGTDSSSLAGMTMLPSMTMTIQSGPGGSSNIEVSTNVTPQANSSTSGQLKQKYRQQSNLQHQQQLDFSEDGFQSAAGGEQYYSSPWQGRAPLISPAKLIKSERLRTTPSSYNHHQQQPRPRPSAQVTSGRLILQPLRPSAPLRPIAMPQASIPILLVSDSGSEPWRPSGERHHSVNQHEHQQYQQQQQQYNFHHTMQELVTVGPPHLIPVYQMPTGELHMTPPPMHSAASGPSPKPSQTNVHHEQEDSSNAQSMSNESNHEVQLNTNSYQGGDQNINNNHNIDSFDAPPVASNHQPAAGGNLQLTPGKKSPVRAVLPPSRPASKGKAATSGGGGY